MTKGSNSGRFIKEMYEVTYSVCEDTKLRVACIDNKLLVREDGMVKNISGHHLAKKEWWAGSNSNSGYKNVGLNKTMWLIHRLIAECFISNLDNKYVINHIDGNKINNNISNLEWVNQQENIQHAFSTGLKTAKSGTNHGMTVKVGQYTLDGVLIKIYHGKKQMVSDGFNRGNVSNCCQNKYGKNCNVYKGYIWKYL